MQSIKYALICISIWLIGCAPQAYDHQISDAQYLHRSMKNLTDVIVHDIFSPPVASRIYVYPSIAAYECLIQGQPAYRSLSGQLHELDKVPQPDPNKQYDFGLAGIEAFLQVGTFLIFSEAMMDEFKEKLYDELRAKRIPRKVWDNSVDFGGQVAAHILAWADGDNYKQTRTFPKFSITQEPGRWKPTPPDYMEGIEPHWREIRTFVIDSAQQFIPVAPPPYDMSDQSEFRDMTMVVYDAVKNATEEHIEIASFWDCNPYVSHHTGHVMYATKKITPGGHWVGITEIACTKSKYNLLESAMAYCWSTIALADGFISCWDEKYRSNLIRPETVINQHIDEEWLPVLQTPPFPEHTSGHSVISAAASVALTHVFGDNFAYVDSVEVEYGLPARSFDSFYQASAEAAISRLYGGIHYMPAITYGVEQGKEVGRLIVDRLQMKKG